MDIICINLDRATDRWTRFTDLTPKCVLDRVQRFSAIDKYDGNKLTELKNRYKNSLANSHAACFISHMCVLENFIHNSTSQYLCVFEDDAKIIDSCFLNVDKCLQDINVKYENIDILYLSNRQKCNNMYESNGGCGTESYIVTKHGAEKMLKLLQPSNGPIDLNLLKLHHSANKKKKKTDVLFAYRIKKHVVIHDDKGFSYLNKP